MHNTAISLILFAAIGLANVSAAAEMPAAVATKPAVVTVAPPAGASSSTPFVPTKPRKLEMKDGKFFMDGQPFQFICGEIHYNRIPRELWRDRLHKARVMGINCVSAYVFWGFHERQPGVFDFAGNADLAEFIRIAHSEGLLVYLRPGPYVCAEYDFGGYPYWLLNVPGMKWRSRDPKFMEYMEKYIKRLAQEVAPLQISRGGPIALVQVENEYGSYGSDKVYLAAIRDMIRKAGFDAPLTTCDGGGQMPRGYVDGCLPTINGATGEDIFKTIDKYHKGGPYFVSEFYPAWFDDWGRSHSRKDKDQAARQLDWMLSRGASVSIYMFHGGTNFWYTNGANGPPYRPQPTSYDYDAPLGEYGEMTPKFMAFREVAQKYQQPGAVLPPVPSQPAVTTVPAFELTGSAPFSAALPAPVKSERPMTMEALHQDLGYVLYRTQVRKPFTGTLACRELRDYAVVLLDGKPVGSMDRRHNQDSISISIPKAPATLEILVENVGRINYGGELLHNNKGITQGVFLGGEELLGWENYRLPLYSANVFGFKYGPAVSGAPAFHRGTFTVGKPGEIFLDFSKWGKGSVWVNGRSLGKFWSIGPQQTIYLPSCWVKKGANDIVVFELEDRGCRTVAGLAEPVLDRLQKDPNALPRMTAREGKYPQLDPGDMACEGAFKTGNTPQTVKFPQPVTARHICIEVLSTQGGTAFAHAAKLEVLDAAGKPLPKKAWKIWFASSEETAGEDGRAENIIDGRPGSFWHTKWKGGANIPPPHVVVVDMGDIQTVSGIRYTGRPEKFPGGVREFRVYARPQFFLNKP